MYTETFGVSTIHLPEPSWYSEAHFMITKPMTRRQRKRVLEERIEIASYGNDWGTDELS